MARFDPKTGTFGRFEIDPGTDPHTIAFDSKGNHSIDPVSMRPREDVLPSDRARGRRIAMTTDGRVRYVDCSRGFLGRLDPASGAVKEWAMPGGGQSPPYAMTVDDQDRLWFVETGRRPNRLVGFDPRDERFLGITPVGSGSGPNTVRHMVFDKATQSIWFGSDQGTIGRAVVPKGNPEPVW